MAIDITGRWWKGTEAADILKYLEVFTEESMPTDQQQLAQCECGSTVFRLQADRRQGAAQRICTQCEAVHFICDSEEVWERVEPKPYECIACSADEANVGAAFCHVEDEADVRWLYLGTRCAKCGTIACFIDWEVPHVDMIDRV